MANKTTLRKKVKIDGSPESLITFHRVAYDTFKRNHPTTSVTFDDFVSSLRSHETLVTMSCDRSGRVHG